MGINNNSFPPIFISTGEKDLLLSQSLELKKILNQANIDVHLKLILNEQLHNTKIYFVLKKRRKSYKMMVLTLILGFALLFSDVQSINQCTALRAGGLLADLLCK